MGGAGAREIRSGQVSLIQYRETDENKRTILDKPNTDVSESAGPLESCRTPRGIEG